MRCSLWTTDGETEIRRSDRVPKELSILIGSIAEPAQVLLDEFGRPGCFAVFADMSVRIEGDFMLRFSVVDIGR